MGVGHGSRMRFKLLVCPVDDGFGGNRSDCGVYRHFRTFYIDVLAFCAGTQTLFSGVDIGRCGGCRHTIINVGLNPFSGL